MEEWIGIYKGLRMPALGLLLLSIAVYVYWPSRKKDMEAPAHEMLADEGDVAVSETQEKL